MQAVSGIAVASLVLFGVQAGRGLWGFQEDALRVVYVCLFLVPAALCIARARYVRTERAPWLLFGFGMVALAAGYAYHFLENPSSPSPSDVLWLLFHVLSFAAVLLLVRSRIANAPRSIAIDALIGALTLAAVAAKLLVDPVLESTGGSIAAVSVNLAYPLFDLLIIGLVAPVLVFAGWRPNREWSLIGAAFACLLALDTVRLYEATAGKYEAGSLPETILPAIMLLLAYVAWRPRERRAAVNFKGWATVVVPSLFVVVAIALTVYNSFRPANELVVVLTTAVLVLAVVRLAATFAEVRALEHGSELERRLQQSQRLESLGQLAGGIAHDFNNLLAVILSCASFVREEVTNPEGSDREMACRDVDEIYRATERAAALTRQLLTFSRRDVIERRPLDLNLVVADLERLLRRTLGEDIEVRTRLAMGLPSVEADPSQLEQVLLNLAVNARDAMPEGGTLTIETGRVNAGRDVRLVVADSGHGMAQELAARAFDPFFSTKPKDQGSGLGLSTVYGIVAGSGGLVDLRSKPGGGTVVEVTLPGSHEAALPRPLSQRRAAAPARAAETTILLVEDEYAVREVTRRILAQQGHEVLATGSPAEALHILLNHEWPLGLLLTDVVMPDMSGKELAERIRQVQPDLPILYMSGYDEETMSRHGALGGGAPLLQKPFDAESLLASVQCALVAK